MKVIKTYLPGLFLTFSIAVVSTFLARLFPIGVVVIGITLGMIIGNFFNISPKLQKGIAFVEKRVLAWAIILMGVKLDFGIIKELGIKSVLIVVFSIIFTIVLSLFFSKLFNFNRHLGLLLGIGNAVCGSSAIAATEKIIGAKKDEVGLAVTIINFLGTMGMFLLPVLIKYIFKFNDIQSGFLIGNTLQAVGQVIGAGFSINEIVGHTATIVKMLRILMLTPLVFGLIYYFYRRQKKTEINVEKQSVPYFVIGFVLLSLIPTLHLLKAEQIYYIGKLSHYFLLLAMVAIGLRINFKSVVNQGKKAIFIGSLIFIFQVVFTLMMICLFL